jgi:prepilin-type processing-associated H-X9-DG protein
MPALFACPHCGEQTLVDEKYAGQSGPCINCGKTIVVPQFVPQVAANVADEPADEAALVKSRRLLLILGALAAAAFVATLLTLVAIPILQIARTNANRRTCAANLRQIGAALLAYERTHGTLPPAVVVDDQGQPMHTWRVLILPYLGREGQHLSRQYRLNEPWDSPHNRQVAQNMPRVFRSPGDPNTNSTETSYVVVIGPTTAFPPNVPLSRNQFADGLHQTLLVLEMANSGICWTEPRDPAAGSLMFQIGADIGGSHGGGLNVLMADGAVRFLPDTTSSDTIMSMATANGRELIDDED